MTRSCIFILLVCLMLLASCDSMSELTYTISNSSSSPLTVVRTKVDGSAITDTFKIDPAKNVVIAVNGEGFNDVNTYKETGDKLRKFTKMDIYKTVSVKSATDFLKSDKWTYSEKSRHAATYTASVTDSDF